MQPVPNALGTALAEASAYQQRYDAGHATRLPLPFHARHDQPVFGAEGTWSMVYTPFVSPGEPWQNIVHLVAM